MEHESDHVRPGGNTSTLTGGPAAEESPSTAATRSPGDQQVTHFRVQLLHLFTGTSTPSARHRANRPTNALAGVHRPSAGSLGETLASYYSLIHAEQAVGDH
jgi:hypothetical protein